MYMTNNHNSLDRNQPKEEVVDTHVVVCLTLLASFFLPSHLSLKHVLIEFAVQGADKMVDNETVTYTSTVFPR